MQVERLRETPRVTKPYSDDEWQAILAAGAAVDERLMAGDVRLTMGGEPTFVALDDAEAPEWNIAALGPTKRDFRRQAGAPPVRSVSPAAALLHYGQGKWYPGEQAARWAFAIHWRSDGQPLWRDAGLIAEERTDDAGDHCRMPKRFAAELCRALGLKRASAIPAYEDAAHFALVRAEAAARCRARRTTSWPSRPSASA